MFLRRFEVTSVSKSEEDEMEIAVFTLPNMVAFEGQHHLLHIFEQRYRGMIDRCVEEKIPLALALPALDSQQNSKLISRDGSTLEPEMIVGAGPVNIVKTLDDGRMLVAINIEHRVQIRRQLQAVPYVVACGQSVPSRIENQVLADFTFERLRKLSKEILADKFYHFEKRVADTIWQNHSLSDLMVRIMEWFRLDSKELQRLLNEPVLENRASRFADVMEFYLRELKSDSEYGSDSNSALGPKDQSLKGPSRLVEAQRLGADENVNADGEDNLIKVDFGNTSS